MLTAMRRLCGQDAMGPSRVLDQSVVRMSRAISPSPAKIWAGNEEPSPMARGTGTRWVNSALLLPTPCEARHRRPMVITTIRLMGLAHQLSERLQTKGERRCCEAAPRHLIAPSRSVHGRALLARS